MSNTQGVEEPSSEVREGHKEITNSQNKPTAFGIKINR
jgi:hypothetical protein